MSASPSVLILIAGPAAGGLTEADLAAARDLLPAAGPPFWLAPGETCEIAFAPENAAEARRAGEHVRERLRDRPFDVAVLPAGCGRRKKLLVADMESTIIREECLDELADLCGRRAEISAMTARAMRGEVPFEAALAERVAMLAGLSEAALLRLRDTGLTLMPGARTLVATMKAHGAFTVLVSGGFSVFASRVAKTAGFDAWQANTLELRDGRLTGRVLPPVLGRDAKRAALVYHAERLKTGPSGTLAVGDGANDLDMIAAAGLGVAFRAKPAVMAQADVSIVHGDLTALLYLQGYRRQDFALPVNPAADGRLP